MPHATPQQAPAAPAKPEPTVVGLGASAGGLAALKTFFAHVSEESGLAFVVVVHLAPDHESHLADLLQPLVKMPVRQVTKTTPIEANQVYVIPPNANLDSIDTHLRLTKLEEKRRERAPIDHFFRTLAQTHDGHAIGVILSGSGSDGTLGLKDIKEKGGLTVVQDPNEAEYDGMPQSAIATGLVDLVLPLTQMPAAILRFARTEPRLTLPPDDQDLDDEERSLLHKIFAQLRARTGRDFSRYKRSTMMRRISRRMQLAHLEALEDYLGRLRAQPEEVRALADDLLITVTNFFRDPAVFQKLEEEVIPHFFEGKETEDEVRVWSVGCATGEEAYSLAILLLEAAGRQETPPRIQIFASDLHEHSLAKAREGFYPGDIESDVSPARLRRFFTKETGGYRVRQKVRELVVFAPHNLLADPPFSRLDLIACRNLLIYLRRDIQGDVIDLFHYALRPAGYLLLGTAESLDAGDLFRLEDKPACLYRKRDVPGPEPRLPVFPLTYTRQTIETGERAQAAEPVTYGPLHQRLVERYAPPSLLVNSEDKVVHLSENAGRYLSHPGGELTANVFQLVREGLRIELRAALSTARERGTASRSRPVPVRFNGETAPVVLHVRPALEPEQAGFILVIFEERPLVEAPPPAPAETTDQAEQARVEALEAELALTRQRLQAIIEEYETGQEEMRAANEEMQSSNEELRSTMEELETSKEELQSINEELQTVNQENRHKVEELAQLSDDLQNLLAATDIATLFLDRDLRILRFTPQVSELFNVRPVDRGRPLSDLTHRLGYDELPADAKQVLQSLTPAEREIREEEGAWYLTRLRPYRTLDDRIKGVVITFIDITERKQAEDDLREAKVYAESIIDTLHEPLLVLSPDLRVKSANPAFFTHFEVHPEETEGRLIYELGNDQWDIPELRTLLEEVLPDSNVFNDFEVTHDFEDIGERVMLLNGRRLDDVQLILLGIRDITERKRAEMALRESEARLRKMINVEGVGVLTFGESGKIIDANDAFLRMHGYSRDEIQAGTLSWRDLTPAEFIEVSRRQLKQLAETGRIGPYEKEYLRKDGSRSWMLFAGASLGDGTIVEYCVDISGRKQTEQALRKSERRFREIFEAAGVSVWVEDFSGVKQALDDLRAQGVEDLRRYLTEHPELVKQMVDLIRIIDVNTKTVKMFGAATKADLLDSVTNLFAPETEELVIDGFVALWEGREALHTETTLTTLDDRLLSVIFNIYFGSPNEDYSRVVVTISDITLQKETEKQLKTTGERLSAAIQALQAGVYEHRIPLDDTTYHSPHWADIIGYSSEELPPTESFLDWLYEQTHPEDRSYLEREYEDFVAGRSNRYDVEIRLRHKQGHWVWVRGYSVATERTTDGRVRRLVGLMFDVTDRKEIEEALRQLNDRLEERVAQRTLELAEQNQRLRQLALQLTEAEQRERRRIARVLHDGLQQLLVAMSINLPHALAEEATEVGKRLEALLEEAMEVTHSLTYELSPPPLYSSTLPDTLRWLTDWFDRHHRFRVELTVADDFPPLAEPLKVFLFEVIRELLLNAVKHSGVDSARVSLHPPQPRQITVTVSDEGRGFDASPLEQPGKKLHGFGLLSIRERLIALGGSLRIVSIPGDGARFELTVPLTEMEWPAEAAAEIAPPVERPRPPAVAPPSPAVVPIRILLVDDRSVVREELAIMLSRETDIEVVGQAGDGLEALDQVSRLQPDVVVMDIEMPRMNGIEATRHIKENYPHIAVIGLSLHDDAVHREKMIEAGAVAHLSKGSGLKSLLETIQGVI